MSEHRLPENYPFEPAVERQLVNADELIEYLEGQIAMTKQHIDDPVDSRHFPSPDYWKGYERALVDTRGWAKLIATAHLA